MSDLAAELDQLPGEVMARLLDHGFDRARLLRLGAALGRGEIDRGLVTGTMEPPAPGDVLELPEPGTSAYRALEERGEQALREGRVALIVLAGGMATRMGGVVKALVEALPGRTFLDIRLAELDVLERRYGKAPPLWLMTSAATDAGIRAALGPRRDGERVATFTQQLSLRLTREGRLFLDEAGRPSEHAPGHGDLPDALKASGLLQRFVDRGGTELLMANLDNLGASLEPALVGFHLAHGKDVTTETVDKVEGDRGGIPVRVDGKLRMLEEFRIPPGFDPASVRVFGTNTFHVNARALLRLEMDWRFFAVEKKVGSTPVVQFERIVNEITDTLSTAYVRLPRTGPRARFLPVKDPDELERRQGEIETVVRARGLLP